MHAPKLLRKLISVNRLSARAAAVAACGLLLGVACACVHGAAGGVERPLLWRFAKDGKTNFLFGTVHAGVDADRELPASVWDAFQGSPCFIMEADQGAIDPRALLAMARLPEGQTLRQLVKPEIYAKLATALAGTLPAAVLDRSQPWFVSIVYLQKQLPDGKPMDGTFAARATAAKKRRDFLEDWREAIGAFASVTNKDDLTDLVEDQDATKKQTDELVDAYRTGDEEKVRAAIDEINSETKDADAKMKVLLDDRNARWLPRLVQKAAGGGCFVAVGAGHLVGKNNLRDRLRGAGYTVTRAGAASEPGS